MAKTKVLLILAPLDFTDNFATALQSLLEESGFQVDISSTMTGTAKGMNGTTLPIVLDLKDAEPSEYVGAILVGGPGFVGYFSGYRLLRGKLEKLHESGKLLFAIGESVLLLARIGLLTGRKIANPGDASMASTLEKEGAIITSSSIMLDGNILTASNENPPRDLASRVLERLQIPS